MVEALKQDHPVRSLVPGTDEYEKLKALTGRQEKLLADNKNADADYFLACENCEIEVWVRNERQRQALLKALVFDKRRKGGKGRAMGPAQVPQKVR